MIRISTAFIATTLVGCSGSSSGEARKPVFPVNGQILVNDRPAAGAFVILIPKAETAETRGIRPHATCDKDGRFQLTTYGENDGAPVGEYFVSVMWGVDGRDDEDRLKGRYAVGAPNKPSVTVHDGPNDLPPIKLR